MDKNECETQNESMGYKDREKALYTLSCLEGRDIDYQNRVINYYRTTAKKILKITKDETKKRNISEAIEIFEEWLRDYRNNDRGKTNLSYISIELIEAFKPMAEIYGILDTDFYDVYKKNNGNYKEIRKIEIDKGGITWDIERNKRLKEIISNMEKENVEWYDTKEEAKQEYPSKEHIRCILLAYSPDPKKLKNLIPEIPKILELPVSEKPKVEEVNKRGTKRSHENQYNSESSENEETPKKTAKKRSEADEKPEEASSLGFKDKEKALKSIESLEGRDISYQYHALMGLMKRAARVISCTKDEKKIENMKAAVEVFENWITDYNLNHRSRENFGYLTLELVKAYEPLAEKYGMKIPAFVRAYEEVDGDYKKLRSVKVPEQDITWDIERNKHLRSIVQEIKDKHIQWFETDEPFRGLPTKEHTECIIWGFSHEPAKLKKTLTLLNEKLRCVD